MKQNPLRTIKQAELRHFPKSRRHPAGFHGILVLLECGHKRILKSLDEISENGRAECLFCPAVELVPRETVWDKLYSRFLHRFVSRRWREQFGVEPKEQA